MTKFSFEVPLDHLEDFHEDQDFIFSLSFLFQDPGYCNYIKLCDLDLWIDNSYNETKAPESVDYLYRLYETYQPKILIAPDTVEWNHQRMQEEYNKLRDIGGIDDKFLSIIIHHPDWIGYYKSWGIHNFCVPYDFRYCTHQKLIRFSECHFLGLVSVDELRMARPPSCDTSMPIKLAIVGLSIDDWVRMGCPHVHTSKEFFYTKLDKAQVTRGKYNIRRLKELCQER